METNRKKVVNECDIKLSATEKSVDEMLKSQSGGVKNHYLLS